jgi:hypothetical protein
MIPWWAVLLVIRDLAIVAVLAVTYGLLLRRFATVAAPYRFQLAERGEKYLALSKNPKEKNQIRFYLDNAFNPWIAIGASLALWIALFMVIMRSRDAEFVPTNEDEYDRICNLFTFSVFAANPLFGIIVALEIIVVTIVVLLAVGNFVLIRRALIFMLEAQVRRLGVQQLHAH